MKTKLQSLLIVLTCLTGGQQLSAQGTAFTYQGRLNNGGAVANGSYDLAFTLYATKITGSAIAGPVTNSAVSVTNGLFTTLVDFGNAFTGASNWLEIAVSTNGANNFTTLAPKQQLAPTPYAIYSTGAGTAISAMTAATAASAGSVAAANIVGTIAAGQLPASVVTNGASGVNITGTFSGDGGSLTNLPNITNSICLTPFMIYNASLASGSVGLSTGPTGAPCVAYQDGVTSDIYFIVTLPDNFNASTATITVYYTSTTASGNFDCSCFSQGTDVNSPIIAGGGGPLLLSPPATSTTLGAGSTSGRWDSGSRMVSMDLRRRGGTAADTSTGILQVYGINIQWTQR
jgi:hypothetical protein